MPARFVRPGSSGRDRLAGRECRRSRSHDVSGSFCALARDWSRCLRKTDQPLAVAVPSAAPASSVGMSDGDSDGDSDGTYSS